MSTVQLSSPGLAEAGPDVEAGIGVSVPDAGRRPSRAPIALIVALLLLILYAAFAHGADSDPAEARVQVALSVVAALAAIAWLWSGTLRVTARPIAIAAAALLAGFALWSGLTLLWSVAPDQTWLEFNRDLAYVIVLVLAFAAGASHRRSLELMATGYLLVALLVTVYAIGQKALPELHIGGLINLDQTYQYARLQAPFDYWNALALFVVLAVPIALVLAADAARPRRIRLASLLAVELMLLVIGLTYSRGSLIALAVAVAVSIGLGGSRLRTLLLLGAAAVAAAVPLWIALTDHALSGQAIPLGQREVPGGQFLIVLLFTLGVLYFAAARALLDLDPRLELSRDRVRALVAGAGCLVLLVALVAAVSGEVAHVWHSFATPAGSDVNNPNVSFSSGYRWVWWKEAVGAYGARPFGGWGAGSFPVLDLLYRTTNAHVQDAHNVPLQWLAETGVVGGLLAVGAYGLLMAAGVGAIRRRRGAERAIAAALLAGGAAYAVHALYDWDWDMPGVTLPVLVFLGVLAGAGVGGRAGLGRELSAGARAVALALCTLVICVYAISAVLPSLAASEASAALTQAGATSSRSVLQRAEATALYASRLDPLSDEGLKAAASISVYLREPSQARAYLLEAVRRDPSDELAWEQLAGLELGLRDVRAAREATERVLELDPRGPIGRQLTLDLETLITPPNDSATATSTPLAQGF
jgi:hypothetical protein